MKKNDLTKLAMLGISAGLVLGGCEKTKDGRNKRGYNDNNKASAAEQMSPDVRSFYSSLSPEAQKKFVEMNAQHKMMAVEMAQQECNGLNKCSGMGGCANVNNSCAGQNSCKGQGGSPLDNPDQAVEVQYQNQMHERQKANGGARRNVNGNGQY